MECQLDPVHGAKLAYQESAAELDYPDTLQPFVDLARALDRPDDRLFVTQGAQEKQFLDWEHRGAVRGDPNELAGGSPEAVDDSRGFLAQQGSSLHRAPTPWQGKTEAG
ncbi:hypothetical protein [Streptomyces cucumeris]|uniref:hypothetical protein n=1 Tax=Streptomyces cucumeris TaxID=2962890 RepID=UPI003D7626DA